MAPCRVRPPGPSVASRCCGPRQCQAPAGCLRGGGAAGAGVPTQTRVTLHRAGEPDPAQSWLHRAQGGSGTPGQAQGTSSQAASQHREVRDPTPSWALARLQARHGKARHSMAWPLYGVAWHSTAQPVASACHGTGRQSMPGAQLGVPASRGAAGALTQHMGSKGVQQQRDSAGQSRAGRRGLGRESS